MVLKKQFIKHSQGGPVTCGPRVVLEDSLLNTVLGGPRRQFIKHGQKVVLENSLFNIILCGPRKQFIKHSQRWSEKTVY